MMCSYLGRGGTSNTHRAGVAMRKWWAYFDGRQNRIRPVNEQPLSPPSFTLHRLFLTLAILLGRVSTFSGTQD